MGKNPKLELKEYYWAHPLFPRLKEKYPDRDYDLQFELMWEWWTRSGKKRTLPKLLSAFSNWLANSKVDQTIIAERQEKYRHEAMKETFRANNINPQQPVSEEGLKKMAELRARWGKKKI